MSNVLEFIVKFKDQLSTGLNGFGTKAEKVFGKMDKGSKQLAMNIDGINKRLNELTRTRDLSFNLSGINKAQREIEKLTIQRDKLMGGGSAKTGGGLGALGVAKGMMGGNLAMMALQMAGAGMKYSVGGAMERGMNQTQFGVLTGSKGTGDKLTKELSKLSADTILGPGVFKNAQTMLSFGVEAKNIMPIMKMLGDISGGSQEKLDGLSLAFANTASAGRLTGQDLLQYVNAGFNPLQEISRTTGKSMGELKAQMEDGGISVKMVADAMQSATGKGGRFNDMLKNAADTPYGKFQKLQGQIQELAIKFGNILMPAVSKLMDFISPAIDKIGQLMEKGSAFITPFVAKIKTIFAGLLPIFTAIQEVSIPWFEHVKTFITRVMNTLAPILTNIANIIGSILSPQIKIMYPIMGKLLDVLGWIIEKIGWVVEKITWLFSKIADGINWLFEKAISITETKTNIIVDTIKKGFTDNQLADFFKKQGEMHGTAYTNAMFIQLKKVANWADWFYNTNYFSQRLEDVKMKMLGTKDVVVKTGGSAYNFSTLSASSSSVFKEAKERVSKDVNGITGGGTRNVYITLGKFQDEINVYVQNTKEGIDRMSESIEDSLLRILNSAGQ